MHPAGLPLTITLPSGWQATGSAPGTKFDAASADGSAHLAVQTGRFAGGTFPLFAMIEKPSVVAHYRAEDPHASVTTKTITLPSGPALESTVRLTHGSPLAIYVFALLHGSTTYHFTFYTSQAQAAANKPVFERAAASITFSK